mmetsp:Transcript_14200/g.30330  ORF Transcript_14200/g.30330 Transcript_14200/m.30330 type:complete len:870 (+) Transcript_14200:422-3031(+)
MSMEPLDIHVDRTLNSTPLSEAGASSASGEPSSELASSLMQHNHHQYQQEHVTRTMQRQSMSKAAHDAIFGRSASTSSSSRSPTGNAIVAQEYDDSILERLSLNDDQKQQHQHAVVTNVVVTSSRSPRMMPAQLVPHAIPTAISNTVQQHQVQAAAPTALTIMRRRRSNSTDANSGSHSVSGSGGLRKDELGMSNSGSGRSSESGSKGSNNDGGKQRSSVNVKSSPKVTSTPSDINNNPSNQDAAPHAAAQQQQQPHGKNITGEGHVPPQYNGNNVTTPRRSHPMGTTSTRTQLAHPSMALEFLAQRDRARWENADYYSGYGMDYGYDYGHSPMEGGGHYGGFSSSVGSVSSSSSMLQQQQQQVRMMELERLQGLYHPTTTLMQQQQKRDTLLLTPQASPARPASFHRNGPPSEIDMAPNNSRRVYQECDYRTDRVWQEDDHSHVTSVAESSRQERRDTEKVSNRERGQVQGYQDSLPPVPDLRAREKETSAETQRVQGQAGGQPGHQGSQLGQQPHHAYQGVVQRGLQGPHVLPPVPQVRAEKDIPTQRQGGHPAVDEYGIYQARMPPYYQAPPSTPVRSTKSGDSRPDQQMDLAHAGPAIYPNGAFFHPQYGLIYPPTPGGSISLPPPHPQLAGIYPQHDLRHQGRMWVDSRQQMQPVTISQAHAETSEESKLNEDSYAHFNAETPVPVATTMATSQPENRDWSTKSKKRVSFSHLQIRTYETILGDNPSCSGGPSLGLGWRYDPRQYTATVDEYEAHQSRLYDCPDGTPYVCRPEDLVLHRSEREAILLNTGYTRQDLAESVRSLNKVKNKRRQTVHNLPVAFVEERVEVVKKTVRRWMWKKERTRYMYEDWKKKDGANGNNRGSM